MKTTYHNKNLHLLDSYFSGKLKPFLRSKMKISLHPTDLNYTTSVLHPLFNKVNHWIFNIDENKKKRIKKIMFEIRPK